MARTSHPSRDPIFTYKGVEYTEALLTQKGAAAVEELLIEIGGVREATGLLVARTEQTLQGHREKYKALTEIRNKLKQFLVPGTREREND